MAGRPGYNVKRIYPAEYAAWSQAKARCSDPGHQAWKDYGARGIAMCDRWRSSFAAFLVDMGQRPAGQTLNRIDNDRGYEPGNCRWVTFKVQHNNRRGNVRVEWRGETKTIAEWATDTGINYRSLWQRLRYGWPLDRAMTAPVRQRRKVA